MASGTQEIEMGARGAMAAILSQTAQVDRLRQAMAVPRPDGARGEPGYIEAGINGESRPIGRSTPRADEIFGGELTGRPLIDVVPEADRGRHLAAIKSSTGAYLGVPRRLQMRTQDGSSVAIWQVVLGGTDPDGQRRYIAKIWEAGNG